MAELDRRTFLGGAAAVAGGTLLAGPFSGFVAGPVAAAPRRALGARPRPARRCGAAVVAGGVRLPLVPRHRVPGRRSTTARRCRAGTTAWPLSGARRQVVLVRNHEINNPGPAVRDASRGVRHRWPGRHDHRRVTRFGEVVGAFTSLNGTQMNCTGGPMPWGSWITCEETINGPTSAGLHRRLQRAPDPAARLHLRGARRRAVDRASRSPRRPLRPRGGGLRPARRDPLPHRGQLRLPVRLLPLHPARQPDANRPARQRRPAADAGGDGHAQRRPRRRRSPAGRRTGSTGSTSTTPPRRSRTRPGVPARRRTTPPSTTSATRAGPRARLGSPGSRARSTTRNVVYFCSTQGGGPAEPGPSDTVGGYGNGHGPDLGVPDSVANDCSSSTSRPGQTCSTSRTTSRPVPAAPSCSARTTSTTTTSAASPPAARSSTSPSTGWSAARQPRFNDEFAGTTFSPDGHTLFVNIQASRGMTFAIWGPWHKIGV